MSDPKPRDYEQEAWDLINLWRDSTEGTTVPICFEAVHKGVVDLLQDTDKLRAMAQGAFRLLRRKNRRLAELEKLEKAVFETPVSEEIPTAMLAGTAASRLMGTHDGRILVRALYEVNRQLIKTTEELEQYKLANEAHDSLFGSSAQTWKCPDCGHHNNWQQAECDRCGHEDK